MSRINRVPTGLQDLLGSKNLGVNPPDLSMVVQPGVDLFPFWASERITSYRPTAVEVTTAQTNYLEFNIPAGQLWIPLHIVALVDSFVGAGQQIQITPYVLARQASTNPGSLTGSYQALAYGELFTATAILENYQVPFTWPQRVAYGGGTAFGVRVGRYNANSLGNVNVGIRLVYYRLVV